MEKPKCRICGERHYGPCFTKEADAPFMRRSAMKPEGSPVIREEDRLLSVSCPVCEARRLQTLERVKRHRASKKSRPKPSKG